MAQINFTNDLKMQLRGWLNREKDYILSIDAMAGRVLVPRVTGTIDVIKSDLDFVFRLRDSLREDGPTEMSSSDVETLIDVAEANPYDNRVAMWKGVTAALSQGEPA